jgi:hypothetical protein
MLKALISPHFCFAHKARDKRVLNYKSGRAVGQAVSRWLRTAAARVRVRAACGVCGGQSGTGAGFSEYFGFPYQSFHQFLHHHNHPELAQ